MSRPLWSKGHDALDAQIMAFLAGQDVLLDRHLFLYDVRASRAHVQGLGRIGLLRPDEVHQLDQALHTLAQRFERQELVLDARFEDGHSAIEAELTEALGELGKKVHTGRSRNDQVLVASRLMLRDALHQGAQRCARIARVALDRAHQGPDLPMPGYTHMQRAVPSSTSMWMAAWAEAFLDDAVLIQDTARWIDANPLGTAAGYGVNLALDREHVTQALGFERMQVNPIYAQTSRGKFELQALAALSQALLDVRRLAWDLSLFTTAEFDFVALPDQYTTGSSIMPNKRNPDVVELLRAAYAPLAGARVELEQILSLPSGYHRDLQATKGPTLRAVEHALGALGLVAQLIDAIQWRPERMLAAISPETYATDRAVELAVAGVPFREAYRRTAQELDQLGQRSPEDSLRARQSPGACADLRLDLLEARYQALEPRVREHDAAAT